MVRCDKPPWWKFWADKGLSVEFLTGDFYRPEGETTMSVATIRDHKTAPEYRTLPAHAEVTKRAGQRVHLTRVDGAHARELLAWIARGIQERWLWKTPHDKHAHWIGILTLGAALATVVRDCPAPPTSRG